MPANYEMTWEPGPRRWRRMVEGKYVTISVREMRKLYGESIPETKEGSYRWANRWWAERGGMPSPRASVQPSRSGYDRDGDYWQDIPKESKRLWVTDEGMFAIPEEIAAEIARSPLSVTPPGTDQPPDDRTIAALVDRYLQMVLRRHKAGEIGVSEYANSKASLHYFRDHVGPRAAVEAIDANRWDGYYNHLIGKDAPKSIRSRRKHFNYARNFIRWLGDLGIHALPPNLDRKQYRFKGGSQAVPTISTEVIKNTVAAAKGQLRLHLMLMINCGFTQQDISDLHPSEIDWHAGRIRRKRSKTDEHENVPMVDYPLWSETFELLKKYRSNDPERVLKTESGRAWLRDDLNEDGSRSRTDAIQSNYRRLVVKGKQALKMLRKASSTLLDGSSEHGRYAIHFLGHAPDIAHRHYIFANGASFDAAVGWLGMQFGF